MNNSPYLHELEKIQTKNELYNRWIDYALELTREDILNIIHNGLTYQAKSLQSMIKEIIASGPVDSTLFKKINLIVHATERYAENFR